MLTERESSRDTGETLWAGIELDPFTEKQLNKYRHKLTHRLTRTQTGTDVEIDLERERYRLVERQID